MFEKIYKNAMDSISVSDKKREEILDKIILEEAIKGRKNPAIPWRIAFACVALVAIVLGVVFAPKSTVTINPQPQSSVPSAVKSYDKLYNTLKNTKTEKAETIEDSAEFSYDGLLSGGDTSAVNNFSSTTEQVEGVSEADIVKTDGKYIYTLSNNTLNIFSAAGQNSVLLSQTKLSAEQSDYSYSQSDMFLKNDRIIILLDRRELHPEYRRYDKYCTVLVIFDVSNREAPQKIAECAQDGPYTSSRMVGDYIYLVTTCSIDVGAMEKENPKTFVPNIICNDNTAIVPAYKIYGYDDTCNSTFYSVVGAYNYLDGALCDSTALLGGSTNVYCSKDNIILTKTIYYGIDEANNKSTQNTAVTLLEIKNGKIQYKASTEIEGSLENQFFIDEHQGYFRFVTTVNKIDTDKPIFDKITSEPYSYQTVSSARLTVLDKELKLCGQIKDLAQGERVYSVRFMGDIAYFVTFRQTDPLFSADLSDPKNPKILGALKIPGFSEYMYPYGENQLLGFGMDADETTGKTNGLKLSMFDISNPADVTEHNKMILDTFSYSPALYNHKAMLVSSNKNLIGFTAFRNYDTKYLIYSYTDNGFDLKASLTIPYVTPGNKYVFDTGYFSIENIRGLFINQSFYIVSDGGLLVYDIDTFEQTKRIDF